MQLPGCGQELPLHPRNSAGQQRVGVTDPMGRSLGLKIRDWPSQSIPRYWGEAKGERVGRGEEGLLRNAGSCRLLPASRERERERGVLYLLRRAPPGAAGRRAAAAARAPGASAAPWRRPGPGTSAPTAGPGREALGKPAGQAGVGAGPAGGGASTSPGSPS